MRDDWQNKSIWMRKVHATACQWDSDGNLLSLTLGPAPLPPSTDDNAANKLTADELEKRERDERRRIAMASSGGLRRRMNADSD